MIEDHNLFSLLSVLIQYLMLQIKLKKDLETKENLFQGSLNVLFAAVMVSIYAMRQMMIFAVWNVNKLYYAGWLTPN